MVPRQLLSEVCAEYELRGMQCPSLNTIAEFAIIRVAFARAVQDVTEQQMGEMASEMREAVEHVKKNEQ
jgi:hypothetical protein